MAVSSAEPRSYWDHTGLAKVVGGFLLAPLAWFIDLQTSYATVKWACEHDNRGVLLLIPLGSLALVSVAMWLCWSSWALLHRKSRFQGASIEDRTAFLAVVGMATNATFALLILTTFAARYFLSPCE